MNIREQVEALDEKIVDHAVWLRKSEVLAILGEEKTFERVRSTGKDKSGFWKTYYDISPNTRKGQRRVEIRRRVSELTRRSGQERRGEG